LFKKGEEDYNLDREEYMQGFKIILKIKI